MWLQWRSTWVQKLCNQVLRNQVQDRVFLNKLPTPQYGKHVNSFRKSQNPGRLFKISHEEVHVLSKCINWSAHHIRLPRLPIGINTLKGRRYTCSSWTSVHWFGWKSTPTSEKFSCIAEKYISRQAPFAKHWPTLNTSSEPIYCWGIWRQPAA